MLRRGLLVLTCLLLCGADYLGPRKIEESSRLFGRDFTVSILNFNGPAATERKVLQGAFELLFDLEHRVRNVERQGDTLFLDEELFRWVSEAIQIAKETGGAYDPTDVALRPVWLQAKEAGRFPEKSSVEAARQRVDYRNVELDAQKKTVVFSAPGMSVDLEDIARSFAVEKIGDYLSRYGVISGIVTNGREIKMIGASIRGRYWRVGLDHPRRLDGYGVKLAADSPIVVSTIADYDDFFMSKGKRIASHLDPRTGFPPEHQPALATVVCENAFVAHALSSALFVSGVDFADELDGKRQPVAAIVIEDRSRNDFVLVANETARPLIREVDL